MSNLNYEKNICSAIEYSKSMTDEMYNISHSFIEKYNLKHFAYVKTFKNGKRLYLASDPEWIECYINNNFHNFSDHQEQYVPGKDINYALWSGWEKDKVFSALIEFGLWHGFTIYERSDDAVDYFDFSTSPGNHQVNDFYINNLDILHGFITQFKKEAAHILDCSDSTKLFIPKYERIEKKKKITQKNINDFICQTTRKEV